MAAVRWVSVTVPPPGLLFGPEPPEPPQPARAMLAATTVPNNRERRVKTDRLKLPIWVLKGTARLIWFFLFSMLSAHGGQEDRPGRQNPPNLCTFRRVES